MDPLDAIMEAIALHKAWLEEARQKGDSATVRRWTRRMQALHAAAVELKTLRALHTPIQGEVPDMGDLPALVRQELAGRKADLLEKRIVAVVAAADEQGVGLDRMLVELWRRFGETQTRKALNNKAYRMAREGLIEQVEGQRGTYRALSAAALKAKAG